MRTSFLFLCVFSLVLVSCGKSGPQTEAREKTTKPKPEGTYVSPFSGYPLDLGKMMSLSNLNPDQIIEKFHQEKVRTLFLDNPERNRLLSISDSDVEEFQKANKTRHDLAARYYSPYSHFESIDKVHRKAVLMERPYYSEPLIVIRNLGMRSHILIHEFAHYLFFKGQSERLVPFDGGRAELREVIFFDVVAKLFEREDLKKSTTVHNDDTAMAEAKVNIELHNDRLKSSLFSARDELDVLALQLRYRNELGHTDSQVNEIRDYYQTRAKKLSTDLEEVLASPEIQQARLLNERLVNAEILERLKVLDAQIEENKRLRSLANDLYMKI